MKKKTASHVYENFGLATRNCQTAPVSLDSVKFECFFVFSTARSMKGLLLLQQKWYLEDDPRDTAVVAGGFDEVFFFSGPFSLDTMQSVKFGCFFVFSTAVRSMKGYCCCCTKNST